MLDATGRRATPLDVFAGMVRLARSRPRLGREQKISGGLE
jgi:hypothetical protein